MFLIKILKTSELELGNFKEVSKSFESAQMKNFNFSTINSLFPTFFATLVFVIVLLNEKIIEIDYFRICRRNFKACTNSW